jgi:hypothetical protein
MKLSVMPFFNDYWKEDGDICGNTRGAKGRRRFLKRLLSKARRKDAKASLRESLKDIS